MSTQNIEFLQLPNAPKLPYASNEPASSYLLPRALDILAEGLELQKPFFFTFGSLDTHLSVSFPHTSKGERSGVITRLVNTDKRITKLSHGVYQITVTPTLTNENMLEVLTQTLARIEQLSTSLPIELDNTLSKETRKLLANTVKVTDTIEALKELFVTDTE